jgi:2-oxoglutarate/2-oxoacid ferredoxin oxidoreductase subunit alpha
MTKYFEFIDEVSVVLCGEAGQGIQTIKEVLTEVFKLSGYNVYSTEEYMSRVRGGTNSSEIRVSSKPKRAFVKKIDILIPLHETAIPHLQERITKSTVVIGEKRFFHLANNQFFEVDFTKIGSELGNPIYANAVAAGVITGLVNPQGKKKLKNHLLKMFAKKGKQIAETDALAGEKGFRIGRELSIKIKVRIKKSSDNAQHILLNGTEGISLGALAGGCNFLPSYPMTPATGVLTFLSKKAREFEILVEQVQDETEAINMAAGGAYAGARAMVSTSGGGFALMTEGVSLCGMTETPLVIYIAMRPGPATGLPTRTEQGDLDFALYSGHGEFPRIILAPGTIEEAFHLTQKAFNIADKFQSPVFVLTDQHFVDTQYNVKELKSTQNKYCITKTGSKYKRYYNTPNGISLRGIPLHGKGLICADSDEHDESGHITESMKVRTMMMNKRLKKLELMKKEALPPILSGAKNYSNLIISWGSTFCEIKEALEKINNKKTAHVFFPQVYPLHPKTKEILEKAKKIILIENNATGQFGKILKLETGISPTHKILKYDGMPFSVEELEEKIGKVVR